MYNISDNFQLSKIWTGDNYTYLMFQIITQINFVHRMHHYEQYKTTDRSLTFSSRTQINYLGNFLAVNLRNKAL